MLERSWLNPGWRASNEGISHLRSFSALPAGIFDASCFDGVTRLEGDSYEKALAVADPDLAARSEDLRRIRGQALSVLVPT
jgi:hypothetical protein